LPDTIKTRQFPLAGFPVDAFKSGVVPVETIDRVCFGASWGAMKADGSCLARLGTPFPDGAFSFHLALGAAFCRRIQAGFCHEVFLHSDSAMPTGCAGGLAGPDVCRPVNVARRAASVSVTFF
jgi:hypothetical protein